MNKRFILWYYLGGQMLGTRANDDNGQPLTKRSANRLAKLGNEKAERLGRDETYQVREIND